MKTILANSTALLALVLTVCCTGCRPETEIHSAAELAVPSFGEKSGLSLPETTRRSLDLKVVEITEQKIKMSIPLSLRIYQANANKILATGLLFPEQTRQLKAGQTIEAKLSDDTVLTGKVQAIRSDLQPVMGSHELLVEFPGANHGPAVGDFISATARYTSDSAVVTIPCGALLENSEGQFAYTVSGEHFVRTAIKTGASNDEFIEVTDGLYAGDQVVSQPVMSLWLTELAAVKGGQACCVAPPKGK